MISGPHSIGRTARLPTVRWTSAFWRSTDVGLWRILSGPASGACWSGTGCPLSRGSPKWLRRLKTLELAAGRNAVVALW